MTTTSLNSTASTQFTIEFFSNTACDPSNHGEGETFLGSTTVTTDSTGNVSFSVSFGTTVPLGQFITSTATDPDNNTSELSQCIEVGGGAVGGIAELPDMGSTALETPQSSGRSVALLAGAALGGTVLLVGAWYARRRWQG